MEAVRLVEDEVRELVRRGGLDPTHDPDGVRALIDAAVADYDERSAGGGLPPVADLESAARAVYDAVVGYGPLQAYLDAPDIEELWLNEHTTAGVDFFAVEVGVVEIEQGGPPAPVFEVVVRPNAWQKRISVTAAAGGGLNDARQDFFADVLNAFASTHQIKVPARQNQNWIGFASGPWGYWGMSAAAANRLRIDAYIDSGYQTVNKALFDELAASREPLEQRLGFPLSWERLDDKRASRIAAYRDVAAYDGEDRSELLAWAVHTLSAMYDVLNDLLRKRGRALRDAHADV